MPGEVASAADEASKVDPANASEPSSSNAVTDDDAPTSATSMDREADDAKTAGLGERLRSAEADQARANPSRLGGFARAFRSIPSLPRLNVHEDQEKFAYIGAILGGVLFILIGKGFELVNPWFAVAVCATIIAAYALFVATKREFRARLDRAGDNCYYLGLTYTLVSMFIALVKLEPGIAPDELIGAFGVALGSTIVGIIARLILIQFKTEVSDVETRSRLDLATASDRLRGELDHASSRFQSFALAIQEAVRSSVVNITDEQLGRQRELITQFSEVLERSVGSITGASEGIEASLKRHTEIAERFDEASSHAVEATRALAEKVANVAIPDDLLTRGFADIAGELRKSTEALNSTLEEIRGAGKIVGDASGNLAMLAENSQNALSAFQGFTSAAEKVSGSMSSMITAIDAGTENLGERNTKLDDELTRLKELSVNYAASLAEVAEFLTKEIGGRAVQR
ncbi:hypothetical protein SAMN04488568_10366 [Maricaulis salignorans]|uniref:Methyl-accepting chemotaxis protein n=1 Tax=Maricaulis salignorans TaxID=144026 RepID=A0A1G9P0K8_9PROT|nr:hypothetical protein SAMN04488568_10366 [Maricaulis salignorans]